VGYGREFSSLDNYKKRMDSVQDVIEGTQWLIKNRYTQEGRIAIYGGSYGGFLVLRSLQVKPSLFAVASESVGITDFVTFLKNTKPYRRKLREVEYGPLSDETFLKSISPMTYLDQIKTPLIIFHGANDPRVPLSETEQLVKALQMKSIPVEFKVFPDEGHGSVHLKNILEQAQSMIYFFEKNLTKK
jgi:dipeptidyl aminopeptidase/acylaminoacyl peptidase